MAASAHNQDPLLKIGDLVTEFDTPAGPLRILDRVTFSLHPAEILALVGETGSGKSVTAKSILRLLPETGANCRGRVRLGGTDLLGLSRRRMQAFRGRKIGMIFQNPIASINPVYTLGHQIRRLVKLHMKQAVIRRKRARKLGTGTIVAGIAREKLEMVGLTDADRLMRAYPHQISGGMAQRFCIATSLIGNPDVLIADEATSALDVTVQSHILTLFKKISHERRTAILLITHDLGIAAQLCHRVAVMYSGRIVEIASTIDLFRNPLHPYTKGLLGTVPQLGKSAALTQIPGTIPDLRDPPSGCRFHPRCASAMEICRRHRPPQIRLAGRRVCCHLYGNRHSQTVMAAARSGERA